MGEGKGSTLVYLLVVVLSLVAFGFAIAAERRRSTHYYFGYDAVKATVVNMSLYIHWDYVLQLFAASSFKATMIWVGDIVVDNINRNYTCCVYDSDVATGYGVGAFLFLFSSETLIMTVTKCMCFGRPLAPGGNRAWSIIYFGSSWLTFLIAEACLVAGAAKNAYHTKYRGMIYAQNWTCESLRKGIFISGAVFAVFTMILNVYFYMYFTKATTQAAHKTNHAGASVGMTGYA